MAKEKNTRIVKKHLILCEGKDEYNFLIAYLNSKNLEEYKEFSNDIQVLDFKGNEELFDFLCVLKMTDGFEKVESLLVIRDAEKDATQAVMQVKSALERAGFPIPDTACKWKSDEKIKVGFLLFPNLDANVENGTLEDLGISILEEHNNETILEDIDTFLKTLNTKHNREFPHKFKTKLYTYFSITDKYVTLKIGEAAKAGAFNWSSEKMNKLKEFMLEVLNKKEEL